MMTVIVTACREVGLTVSEAKTETMLLHSQAGTLGISAASQAYKQANDFVYLEGSIAENGDLSVEIKRRVQRAWASYQKYKVQLYNQPSAALPLKVRMVKAEAVEALLYGCVTWTIAQRPPPYFAQSIMHCSGAILDGTSAIALTTSRHTERPSQRQNAKASRRR